MEEYKVRCVECGDYIDTMSRFPQCIVVRFRVKNDYYIFTHYFRVQQATTCSNGHNSSIQSGIKFVSL